MAEGEAGTVRCRAGAANQWRSSSAIGQLAASKRPSSSRAASK